MGIVEELQAKVQQLEERNRRLSRDNCEPAKKLAKAAAGLKWVKQRHDDTQSCSCETCYRVSQTLKEIGYE